MKQFYFIAIAFFLMIPFCFAKTPECLLGIWENDDRLIFFGEGDNASFALKLYYGWYYDYAAKSDISSETKTKKNAASSQLPQEIKVDFNQIVENENIYEISLIFDKKTCSNIPIAIVDDKMYLDFFISNNDDDTIYFQGINSYKNIRIFQNYTNDEIFSFFVCSEGIFRLRYWKTNAEYDENAIVSLLTDKNSEKSFSIKKYIYSDNKNWTCVQGRRKNIRNIEKISSLPENYKTDENNKILYSEKNSFKKLEKGTFQDFQAIIKEANSRRKLPPPPIFPVKMPKSQLDVE